MKSLFALVVCLGLIGSSAFAAICDYNGCTYATADTGITEITFNSSGYFPSCIRVDVGSTVTFTGSFDMYPITSGYLNGATEVAATNDISNVTTGATANFTMITDGVSAFFSPGTNGALKGAIYVGTSCDPAPPVSAPPVTAPVSAPVAAPTTPVAAPTTPVAAPTAAPVAAPVSAPTAAPTSSPVAAPVAAPVDNTPTSAPLTDTPVDSPVASPHSAPVTSAPRPQRVRVSSAAQAFGGLAVLAAAGVAML